MGSAGAEGAVDSSGQVANDPLSHQSVQELSFFVHVVHVLLLHDACGQAVIVVQRRPLLGQVVAESRQADLVTQQAG